MDPGRAGTKEDRQTVAGGQPGSVTGWCGWCAVWVNLGDGKTGNRLCRALELGMA